MLFHKSNILIFQTNYVIFLSYYKSKKDVYLDLINYWVLRYSAVINHLIEEDHSAA